MGLFQTGLFRNGRRCVFVERAPVAREVELLVDIDVLIAEDLRRAKSSGDARQRVWMHCTSLTYDTALGDQERPRLAGVNLSAVQQRRCKSNAQLVFLHIR